MFIVASSGDIATRLRSQRTAPQDPAVFLTIGQDPPHVGHGIKHVLNLQDPLMIK